MKALEQYPLQELKLIYRLLQSQLAQQPQLMDSDLLQDLQFHLQQLATADGIDVSHHAQWARWLEANSELKIV